MERRLPPSPYKLITWKHSTASWASTFSQHIFDCINDPMGKGFEGALQYIPDYCIELREHITKIIDEINSHPSLLGTGCKYYPIKINAVDGSGRSAEPGHGKARAWILLKLANMYDIFRESGGKGYEKSEAEELRVAKEGGDALPGYSEGEGSNYASLFQRPSKN
ncbi:hypothetical protein TWF569_007848 [Orbilia oligospora]|uniref:Uncharacterized protein n=1 Tax=Orbilia oligospora TaxID=2813651 RepID=A0A7C8NTL5_ORBOL|nr:hypothetical protein TWF706_005019 [Orbilia oligospora]KAF3107112.1 hypothetical protein TWF102_000946 [Orbilia oligospora]KAF3108467.1 hypothetical protein TWF103_005548 [Orbilia oligospora]KAF3108468.1 hypothetical protein TWF103_005548 [Orbilia oligospora]KAF3121900.1 hypothetical protein TWF703_001594 [Orbilia oligospora]